MSKAELERNIRSLDERISRASPSVRRALEKHRDAFARQLAEYEEPARGPMFSGCVKVRI